MRFDLETHLGEVDRSVDAIEYEGRTARAVRLERSFNTNVDDLWDALTNPERLPRWFLPVTGDLRLGGRYQLEGNAEGTITRCEPPRLLFVTWEFGGGMSWVDVQLRPESDAASRLSLTHIVPVDEHWQKYGAGATGVGWDLGLVGLAMHVDQPDAPPVDEAAFFGSAEGKAFIRASSERWGDAASAGSEDPEQARAAMKETTAFYTGEPLDS